MFDKKRNYEGVKAFLIARVSDPSQVDALPAQILRLKEYANNLKMNYELHSFDETAYKDDRRKFQKIVDKIAQCEGVVVVFDKIDRFTRDASSEVVRILKDRVKEGQLELHFPSDGLIYTKNSPACDKTKLDIGMVFGGYYSSAISDNVKRRIEQKLHDGEFPGKAPIGYKNIDLPDGKKDIVLDPERSEYIKKIFELRLSGQTLRSIAKIMRNEGLLSNTKHPKPITKSTVENILDNPFYYGTMRYNGCLYQHRYEPLIEKRIFDKVQQMKDENLSICQKNKANTKYIFAFNGILKCAVCGCSMSSYYKKGHIYLKCSQAKGKCSNHASEVEVMSQVYEVLDRIAISQKIIDELIEDLKNKHENIQLYYRNAIKEVRKSYEEAEKKKDLLYEDRLSGRITVDEYDRIAKRIQSEMEELDAKLMNLTNNDKSFEVDRSYLLKLASKARKIFESSKPEQKNKILKLLFSNLEINEKRLNCNLLEPFNTLSTMSKSRNWLPHFIFGLNILLVFHTRCNHKENIRQNHHYDIDK